MIQRFTYTQLIITSTTVAGGLMLGLLLLSRSKKQYGTLVAEHITEIADWVDAKGRNIIPKSPAQLQHLRGNVRERLKRHIPDLYEATEHINLNEPYLAGA